ncbi:gliding motility-associated C-terminal domain-containing protein [Chryseobacterium arachidis]|uniref:Gliding motility-associated C-terminal domain-containing protein n=2 Tax=Chryseobacterium arachidis TaxID=1416778 RepID=A0A1M5FT54_9FLAO|nr:T9SS type B sorting domain-containing protein [Chryseobacterium arachidis]SHF94715.1 gliding motility-associated C-terminal domain-containing protein [Chryseobacterium arachidis]
MKKILFGLLILCLTFSSLFAQRDTEHWIAPYYASTAYTQALYLSTDSTTPVDITVSSNNTILGTVAISKSNPQIFVVPVNNIAANAIGEAFSVINKGIYVKGTRPFYCSLRMVSSTTHAEIITSKGKAGIGKEFYVAGTPSTATISGFNFSAGVMATEDNTVVTATWNGNVTFINGTPPANTHTFTLNKGQSFIFAGLPGTGGLNLSSFIGAKIVSDKPITLTNGNVNGNFGANTSAGSDAILDQSVPTERLGNTFAMVRTRSTTADLEGGIVVGTEDNTQIFINGAATPIATIDRGEYYRISGDSYVQQGTSGHYNMFISTTKNVYLYQLVSVTNSSATCGFNYIPPLNCFLPRKIDEIGKINEMPTGTGTTSVVPSNTIVKLNILTEVGATVTVNGVPPLASEGPFPLTGNTNWVTYAVPSITGNVSIVSNKAVTAGINGGYSTSGYGGYFAGFSSIPLIAKQSGDCIPGIILEVDDSYDTYQWYLNGNPIPGATSNSYTPVASGNYTVRITVGSCPPATTPIYKVYTCLNQSTKALTVCEGYKAIVPEFTNSTQTYVPGTVTIVTQPTNGTVIIDPNGVIGYTPNFGFVGTDTIVYKFCGNDPEFTDCEQITLTLTVSESPTVTNATLRTCFIPDYPATGLFNLTTAPVTSAPGIIKQYYPSPTDAQNGTNEITNPTDYVAPNGVVYIKVSNANGCYRIAEVSLVVFPPTYSTVLEDKVICMEDTTTLDAGPGFTSYDWSTGGTGQSISNVSVGTYWVDLKTGQCVTRQKVTVYASEQPVIAGIDISNNKIAVNVTGGKAPYQYSIDNISWQDSNVFENVPRGNNTVYVKDAYDCDPNSVEVTVPNLINVITPNGDGVNDVLDYSALAHKPNFVFNIYDRYGSKMHRGNKTNEYKWDGTVGGKKVSTGNYWFDISWNEPNSKQTPVKYSGWILVKNRE